MTLSSRLWLPLLVMLGCEVHEPAEVAHQGATLEEGVAARVGNVRISLDTVRRVTEQRRLTPEEARSAAVRDALFAQEARKRLAETGAVSAARRSALSRALLEQLKDIAVAAGPPTASEQKQLVEERWYEFERPAAARTTHAVALTNSAASREAARTVAQKLHQAVQGAKDPREFAKRASAVETGPVQVRVERLPPVTPDGRVLPVADLPYQGGARLDAAFAEGAAQLRAEGDVSPIVESPFGFHVIFLEQRLEPRSLAEPKVREKLERAVISMRAHKLLAELLDQLHVSTPVERSSAADSLTAKVTTSQ